MSPYKKLVIRGKQPANARATLWRRRRQHINIGTAYEYRFSYLLQNIKSQYLPSFLYKK